MSAARLSEIRAELQVLAGAQEAAVSELLAATLNAINAVASDKFPGRVAVRNEARRLRMVLEREAPSFARIVEQAS